MTVEALRPVRLTDPRVLRVALGLIWLLDTVLLAQPVMFAPEFASGMIQSAAAGNPGFVAAPMLWVADQVQRMPVQSNLAFIAIQLLIAIGLFQPRGRRTVLGLSIAWSVATWWLGEGFAGMLNGTASPLMGAPGAVILYAVLAILLWPGVRPTPIPWVLVWLAMAWFACTPASRAPDGPAEMIRGMANGEPGWLAGLDRSIAGLLSGQGLLVAIVLCAVCVFAELGIFVARRAALVVAMVVAGLIWIVGENFGGILTGQATDPNSGPLLVLLALAYWPRES